MSKNGYYTAFGDFKTINNVVEHMDPLEEDQSHHDDHHNDHHDNNHHDDNHHNTNHDYIKCPKGYVCIPYDEFDQMMRGMDPSTEPPVEVASMPPVNKARSLSDRSASIIPMDTPVLAENMDMPVQAENMDMPRQEE